ncbi:hypothetical protein [Marinilabilia sp.]|uniref:hypothetical protein n=1 Tax=Marinilabilia sp. TaxID=2021252 RepID=UPI0025B8EA9A|nr:hypothetical protein [Marinilabilia sp.]
MNFKKHSIIKDGDKIGKFYAIIILGFIIMVVIGITIQKSIWKKFPKVQYQSETKGEIYRIRNNRGIFGELKSGQKIFFTSTSNYNYKPSFISDFISRGDSILKPANSDSIFVFKDDKKYFFILGKSIEKR